MFDFHESFEAVSFQRDNTLRPKVLELFQRIFDDPNNDTEVERVLQLINDYTFKATGVLMTSKVYDKRWFFGAYEISVTVPNINALSPVNKSAAERMSKIDIAGMTITDVLNGKVDFKNGRVSGFFSEVKHSIKYSRKMFTDPMTAVDVTALYFHELGHAWVNLAYLAESLATNVILAEIVGQYDMQTTVEKKFQVGRAALKLAQVNVALDEDATGADLTALVLKGQCDRMQTTAGTRWYDERLAETMADQFAVRFGAGADLGRALVKLEKTTHLWADAGYEPKWLGLLFNFGNIVTLPFEAVADPARRVAIEMIKSISKTFLANFFLTGVCKEIFKKFAGGHPPLRDRLDSIRREMLSELKNRDLPEDQRKIILDDLQAMDETMKDFHPFTDVYAKVTRRITDLFSGRTKEMGKHQVIEDLANNRLYEFSAQLKG